MVNFRLAAQVVLVAFIAPVADAFVTPGQSSLSPHLGALQMAGKNVVVISPPGGLGEVTAVDAAKSGNNVKWFVISPSDKKSTNVAFSSFTLKEIEEAGGKVELAGADVDSLISNEESATAAKAVSQWCGAADALICTYDDGIDKKQAISEYGSKAEDMQLLKLTQMRNAIKVAAKEASSNVNGMKVAVLPADVETVMEGNDDKEEESGNIVSSIFKRAADFPETLKSAMAAGTQTKVTTLRYGSLFGAPQTSPEFSPFIGGPRREPVLRDELTMRSVRMDLSNSISGKMMETKTRSSRLSVGEAAILMAVQSVPLSYPEIDVCLTSLRGVEPMEQQEWKDEFKRIEETLTSTSSGQLFKASLGGVPNLDRLTQWLATKWAPAVLRTYEIAGIRVGARPVFINTNGNTIEIVWQELVNMSSQTVGKLIIDVSDDSIVASRAAGDAAKAVPQKPFPGEDVLVRRLSDAVSQAIDKGLANKPKVARKPKKEAAPTPVAASTLVTTTTAVEQPKATSKTGPRTAGARRSSQRPRGKRKPRVTPVKEDSVSDDSNAFQ